MGGDGQVTLGDSVMKADCIVVIGANPSDAHPVFASQMKRRLREGANLIVIDPRSTDLVESAHIKADFHLPLRPGTNVAVLNAIAHTIVTEGLAADEFIRERCEIDAFEDWKAFISKPENSPESVAEETGVAAEVMRRVLVDHARHQLAAKRGGGAKKVTLTGALEPSEEGEVDLLDLDEALNERGQVNERQKQVIDLRFFGGLTGDETAHVLGVSRQTVTVDWKAARAWLRQRLVA